MPYFFSSTIMAGHILAPTYEPEYPTVGLKRLADPKTGVMMSISTPMLLPQDAFPRIARATKNVRKIPDLLSGWFFGVSEKLRTLIEEFEPSVHQFSEPIELYDKFGNKVDQPYFVMNIRAQTTNTVIWEQSKVPDMMHLHGWDDELVFDQNVVAGKHIWRALDLNLRLCMSDEFRQAIKKHKIGGFDFIQHQLVGKR